MGKYNSIFAMVAFVALMAASCSKVEPTGVLIGHTSVDDRVKQSVTYQKDWEEGDKNDISIDRLSYSFIVGSDSHLRSDQTRLRELFEEGVRGNDLFVAHCGDLAETQPEYYQITDDMVDEFREKYPDTEDSPYRFRFFPVVGNHDVTRNGWAMFTKIFGSSTYTFDVVYGEDTDKEVRDAFIFLDSANGTFGEYQIELIDLGLFLDFFSYRHIFVFTHTNFFRPRTNAFSSVLPREELYYMFKVFHDWGTRCVFCGHIHAWDERDYAGVHYITLDAMSLEERPDAGDVVRCNVKADGSVTYDHVYLK